MFNFRKIVEKRADNEISRTKKGFVPQNIKRRYLTHIGAFNEMEIATFKSKKEVTNNHVIFFHGGAYIFEANPGHWKFAENIVKNSFCRMTLVDYPLAPEHTYKETFAAISGAFEKLLIHYPEDNYIFIGDSAGGGLALAFTQKLNQEKHKTRPVKVVLLSPWLDITLSNPEIRNQESLDYILTVKMLQNAGMKYSNGDNRDHYLLSPINGELEDLPETMVFYGTEELFYPDCKRLKSMIASDKQSIIFREYQKMQHDWALFPLPESKQVVDEICAFMKDH